MKHPLHEMDVTDKLAPYIEHPNVFHILGVGNPISGAVFLSRNPHGNKLILSYNPIFSSSGLDVYDVKLNHVGGLSVGFLFYSPLRLRGDSFYLLFYRPKKKYLSSVVQRKKVGGKLVFHSSTYMHYIVLRNIEAPIIDFITE